MQLSKELGCQHRTAWHMLHRIREACGKGDFTLANVVEVDEAHVGGKEGGKHGARKLNAGRGAVGKVAGARERGGKVNARPVKRTDDANLEQGGVSRKAACAQSTRDEPQPIQQNRAARDFGEGLEGRAKPSAAGPARQGAEREPRADQGGTGGPSPP